MHSSDAFDAASQGLSSGAQPMSQPYAMGVFAYSMNLELTWRPCMRPVSLRDPHFTKIVEYLKLFPIIEWFDIFFGCWDSLGFHVSIAWHEECKSTGFRLIESVGRRLVLSDTAGKWAEPSSILYPWYSTWRTSSPDFLPWAVSQNLHFCQIDRTRVLAVCLEATT